MEPNKHSLVIVKDLTHYYGAKPAIQNISMEFGATGIYGLLGSNGAGKSTTMNIMCGVLKPSKGDVFIQGIPLREKPEAAKKHLGFLPQRPPLHGELTVREYLRYTAGLRQIAPKQIQRVVDEVIDRCMLMSHERKMISSLSGGYQQRVGIAQAIIHKPDIVVFDEPTNGLDPNQTETIRNLIQEIGQERTVILSTHILSEVEASCHHIFMIEHGKLVFDGEISNFRNYLQPESLIVRLGTPPTENEWQNFHAIKNVEKLETQKGSGERLRIRFHGDADELIDQLVASCVLQGWQLREIQLEKNTAEEIFAALSKKNINE